MEDATYNAIKPSKLWNLSKMASKSFLSETPSPNMIGSVVSTFPRLEIGEKYFWKALSRDKNDMTRAVAQNDETVSPFPLFYR